MGKLVLLIEDNCDDAVITERLLLKSGIADEIVIAQDGFEALDYLFGTGLYKGRDLSVMPGVVLLDLKMPGMDGFEVLQRIRSSGSTRTLPVVILSTSCLECDIERAYKLGTNDYIQKHVGLDRFQEALKRIGAYTHGT